MPKIYIETYGCSENINESQIMAGLLEKAGFEIVKNEENSDLIIVNTCYVKTSTEQKIFSRLHQINKTYPKKKLIVAGCMPEKIGNKLRHVVPKASFVSTHHITDIQYAVKKVLDDKIIEIVGESEKIKLCLPKIRENELINIVPISSGCNSSCSYCCVRLAKGKLFSYPKDKIIKEVASSAKCGTREIWLTSQDNAAYGMDGIKERLPELINDISKLKGCFFVRVGMMNPKNVLPILPDLINAYKNEKIYKFLHLPVQSGNDDILNKMNRGYKVKDFKKIVDDFRKDIRIQLWTDVIVGYPGETEEQFNDTLGLIKNMKPDWVNISKYGHRPYTKASKLEALKPDIVNERSRRMLEESRKAAFEKKKEWIGWRGVVLIAKVGKEKEQWLGRNVSYEPVIITSKKDLLGKIIEVEIGSVSASCLFGRII